MTAIVLVHGAFHGAWCWKKLLPALAARGQRTIAPDMPGSGDDQTPPEKVTFAACVERIDSAIAAETEPVLLVGHSLGGMAISAFAEAYPERLRRIVYLASLIPKDGKSVISMLGAMKDPNDPEPTHDPLGGILQPVPYDKVGERYYNDCSPEDAEFAVSRLRPQPNGLRLNPIHLTAERFDRVPRSFIGCTLDRAQPPYRQKATVARTPCDHVLSLPTGHSPFLSAPEALADMLTKLAAS